MSSLGRPRQLNKRPELEDIAKNFHLGLPLAARALHVCTAQLKRLCRNYGIHRWPSRKITAVKRLIAQKRAGQNLSASLQVVLSTLIKRLRELRHTVLVEIKTLDMDQWIWCAEADHVLATAPASARADLIAPEFREKQRLQHAREAAEAAAAATIAAKPLLSSWTFTPPSMMIPVSNNSATVAPPQTATTAVVDLLGPHRMPRMPHPAVLDSDQLRLQLQQQLDREQYELTQQQQQQQSQPQLILPAGTRPQQEEYPFVGMPSTVHRNTVQLQYIPAAREHTQQPQVPVQPSPSVVHPTARVGYPMPAHGFQVVKLDQLQVPIGNEELTVLSNRFLKYAQSFADRGAS